MRKLIFALAMLGVLCFGSDAGAENVKIRFGILPVLDTLPLQVAVRDGLFQAHGLDVELVPFASALERDTAMQAGQLDGYFGDLIATYMLIQKQVPMYIALTSWRTRPGNPMFGIALSPANRDAQLDSLKGVKIGYSRSTIMEFLLDKMEARLGVGKGHFERVEVKKIPIRMQMLLTDQLGASLLPEPLLSLVRLKGGSVIATCDELDVPLTVLCLHKRYFDNGATQYSAFVDAYAEAVEHIRANPENYRRLMAETCRIPKPLAPKFPVYDFPLPAMPSDAELDEVEQWMVAHGLLERELPNEMVLAPVLP
ncbi:ABC transporter substrate-binding protein [Pseudodesulfovibrio tunisiensis]|uniref:ABC transporter substrate-binding protein n=1 Tax=Pseudodesulfovibrio tunisiensis TaxID=463192 RepID=UPI001FB2C02B|nr:ABC transporter substrate-binding protein [Pseudodesulfovibrio tunisiensis]